MIHVMVGGLPLQQALHLSHHGLALQDKGPAVAAEARQGGKEVHHGQGHHSLVGPVRAEDVAVPPAQQLVPNLVLFGSHFDYSESIATLHLHT